MVQAEETLWLLAVQLSFEQVCDVSHMAWAGVPFARVNPQVQIDPLAAQGVVKVDPTTQSYIVP